MPKKVDAAEVAAVRVSDVESNPQGIVKRWLAELALAEQTEDEWLKKGAELWEKYEAEKATASEFNIFWANTEILSAAVYNSTPQPDVRRRFRDADPVGKHVAQVLERSLSYEIDAYEFDDFDSTISDIVLDTLIVGRGVAWLVYEPTFVQVTPEGVKPAPPAGSYVEQPAPEYSPDSVSASAAGTGEQAAPPTQTPAPTERLVDQHVKCEHVQWDDFRHGPGKRWNEVPWVARRHYFTHDMAEAKFGEEVARKLTYSQREDAKHISDDRQVRAVFKTCEVWEIWDKDKKRVLFIAPSYKEQPCRIIPDPLKLKQFFPMPKPCYAIQNSRTLVPVPLYKQYEAQAKELNKLTARIHKIEGALKLRGAYNSNLPELEAVMRADDTDMVPVRNSSEIAASGGLDKSIWLMPVDKLIQVLRGLYEAREQLKQTIYEICGIADILRGASDPRETKGAQVIKSQWGSLRVQKLQRQIHRMVRDLIRLKAEIIAEQFTQGKLAAITNVQLPTQAVKDQAKRIAARLQQTQQPIPPDIQHALRMPSWEDVIAVMRSDEMRCYRIDIETDSTVAETINRDMQGLAEVISSVGQVLGAAAQGVPPDVVKQVALTVVRRARLGSAVEDALESFEPQQQDNGAQALEAARQQILELIRSEGEKQVREKDALMQQQQGLQRYDQQISQALAQFSAAAQATALQAAEQQRVTTVEKQVLTQLAQAITQIDATQRETMKAIAQLTQALRRVEAGVMAPKTVTFTRGGPDNRIVSATATVQ